MSIQPPQPRRPRKPRSISKTNLLLESFIESQELFHQIFARSPIAIILSRISDGRFFDANASFLELTGYSLQDVIGRSAIELGLNANPPTREERLLHLKHHGHLAGFELTIKCKSGALKHVLTTVTMATLQGEEFAISMFIDITERKQTERQLAQMKRLYATLSQVNQTIVRVRDRSELYQSICNIAVQFGGFSLAWVGLLDDESGELRPVAAGGGIDVGEWPFDIVNIRHGKLKNGLAARAMRTSRVVTSEDVQQDKRIKHKNIPLIQKFGFHSSAVVPFRLKGKTIGIVVMVSTEPGLFKAEEEIHLLEEMSLDISFALDTMQVEIERSQAEQQVRTQATQLKILADASKAFVQAGQDYATLLDGVVRLVADVLADTCYIRLLSDDGERLELGAIRMKDPLVFEVWGKILAGQTLHPEDPGMVAQVFRLGQPAFAPVLRIEQLRDRTPPAIWPYLDRFPPHSMIVTPLTVQGRSIGVLVLIRHLAEQPSFTEDDVSLANDLAGRAALVINNARLLQQVQDELAERKRAEAMRDQLARIVEASEDAILSKTLEGIITSWNRGAERLYGYTAEEVVGRSISLIIPPDRPKELADIVTRIQRSEHVQHFETVRLRKDGTRLDVSVTVSPIRNDDGTIIGASTIARDITERKTAERRLSESEAHLRAVHDALAEGIAFIDMDGTILSKNHAADKVLGRAVEELTDPQLSARLRVVRSDGEPFPLDEQPAFVALHRGQPVRNVEMGIPARDGTLKWTVVNAQLVRDLAKGGATLGVVVSFFDITDRKRAEQQIRNQLQHLNSLREIDTAILSSVGMRIGLDAVVSRAILELNVDAADILVLDPDTNRLEYRSGWGFDTHVIQNHILQLGEGIAGRCARDRQSIYVPDLREHIDEFSRKSLITEEKFIAYYCVPLMENEDVKGVLEIFHRSRLAPDQDWIDFLHILAGQAAIAIQSATLFEGLQRSNNELALAYDATIEGWSRAMDLRDKETAGHTQRVTEMTLQLAQAMGMGSDEMVHIRRGALLHDMGKLGVPDEVLLKPGKLTDEEWVAMKKHPQHAYDMLSSISYLVPALDIPYCHHEKWDGTGYPRGLKGEEIPLSARLFAVVDVWDALSSDRPYRASWPQEKVLEHIRAGSGNHFDPHAVEIFMKIMAKTNTHHNN